MEIKQTIRAKWNHKKNTFQLTITQSYSGIWEAKQPHNTRPLATGTDYQDLICALARRRIYVLEQNAL